MGNGHGQAPPFICFPLQSDCACKKLAIQTIRNNSFCGLSVPPPPPPAQQLHGVDLHGTCALACMSKRPRHMCNTAATGRSPVRSAIHHTPPH
eukprot:365289-Chlamydomonas_euryale.AAC.22